MGILVIEGGTALPAVRDRLASDGYGDVELSTRADFFAGGGRRRAAGTAVLVVDDPAEPTPAGLREILEAIRRSGGGGMITVLLDQSRTPDFACAALEAGADDVLRLPADLPFLARRLTALARRRAAFDWPTSVESELRLLHSITLAVSEAESFSAAILVVLRMICDATGWILGQAWIRRMDSSGLQCSPEWHAQVPGLEHFRQVTEGTTFELGVGLPGQVWASQQRAWVDDVSVDDRFVRTSAARKVGLKAGFFVPIIADGQVMAVLEFFVFERRREDEQLLDLVSGLATQLGSIIERKRLEEAYRLLSTGVEQMGEAILITSAEEGASAWPAIIFANPAVAAITGYSLFEVAGRSPGILFGARADELILPRFEEAMARGRSAHGEIVSQRKDGSEFDLDWRIAPVRDSNGRIRYLIANLRDITDRMRVERSRARLERALNKAAVEWRQTFDAIEWPIFILDERGRIRRLNRAAQEVSGRSFEDNLGTSIETVGSGEPWRRACTVVSSLHGEASVEVLQDAPGTGRTWQIGARRFRAQEGSDDQEQLILLIARDISATIRLQDSLRRSQTMASMGSLVAGVAHEVRNPLFGISATLDAFEARFGSQQEYRAYTAVLRGEVDRLNELMRELLEYGRKPNQQPATGQIAEVIARAVDACKRLAEPNQVRLVVEPSAPALPTLPMDFGRLVQVFRNLIENAIQHSPWGGLVTVRTAIEDDGGGKTLCSTVEDAGPGFRSEDLAKIFEPFFTKRRGGTGLGLSIVQKILEQHGGAAVASNRPEGGAVVTIRLPLPGAASGDTGPADGPTKEGRTTRAA
jgi:PAS domain S-box-containing protein